MFYPKLTRRNKEDYKHSRNDYYADYRKNYKKVAEDCKHRCVYCDLLVTELGGDELQLDHFRPQELYPELERDPYNLYLSCPKCNILKSSDWPCYNKEHEPTFIGKIGYIDSFNDDPSEFLIVKDTGHISSIDGPIDYMIKQMQLNRESRVQNRRKRIIDHKKETLLNKIMLLTEKLGKDLENSNIDIHILKERLNAQKELLKRFSELN